MRILIVAKTRRGAGACVGGITEEGHSVRLIASDAACNERAGLEFEVGEVWEIDSAPDPDIVPPHVENIIVLRARRLRRSQKVAETIHRFMPPLVGGPEKLFDGLTQATSGGGLYIAGRTGLPHRSTMFWMPDQPLRLDSEGKRLRYRFHTSDGGRTLTFVGFQEPLTEIPAGAVLRVSLAHWWRPKERPTEELRCFVQLSGWFLETATGSREPLPQAQAPATVGASASVETVAPSATLQQRALQVLRRTFGFSQFFPVQAEVIVRVLQHRDALVVIGKEHSTEQWRVLAQQFIRLGLLEQDFEFGSLRLAPKGWDVLHGKAKALVRRERAPLTPTGTAASGPLTRSAVIRPATRHRFQEIGQLFAAGQNLKQLARHFDILPETVIQNLYHFHEAGGTLDPERLLAASRLPGPERARVLSAFERLGHQRLAPVYEALSRAVAYQELHLLRLYRLLTLKQYD